MKDEGKKYELTESRETFIKGGFISIFADTTNKYCLFRFGPFFHKLKLSEANSRVEEMDIVNPEVTKSHQIRIHIICTTPGIQVQKLKRNHSSTEDREKVCVHMQLHSQIDRLFFF